MSRLRRFLSDWTRFDELAAAYSQSAFEQMMLKRRLGRRWATAIAAIAAVLAVALALATCALLFTAAKRHYLQSHGSEAVATATARSFHTSTDKRGTLTHWQTLEYRFATRSGETIDAKISRQVAEYPAATRGSRFTVRYWEPYPSMNEPKGMRVDALLMLSLSALLSAGVVHLTLLIRRLWRWRGVGDDRVGVRATFQPLGGSAAAIPSGR